MAGLKNIKLKIQSVKKTSTVTRAMEAVSAVKMRKSQERALGSRPYAAAALSMLERIAGSADLSHHTLMQSRQGKTALVLVTSDKGLAGSLNSAVIKRAERELRERHLEAEHVLVFAIGKRGAEHFANRGYEVRARHENMSDDVSEADVREIADSLIALHATDEVGSVVVAYTNFVSTFEQEPTARQIVPITQPMVREMVDGIRPARGKYAPSKDEAIATHAAPYEIEPSAEAVLTVLLPKLIGIALFHAILESKSSEHSARMVAMKSATDNAKERAKQYTRLFNKIRQASITREISEITSGIEAMR